MVKKHEVFKSDGNHNPWWGSWFKDNKKKEYKKHEAQFILNHYETSEELNMVLKSLIQDWKDSIDEQEKQGNEAKNSPTESKQNVENNEVPVTESETTKLTKQVSDIVKDKIKPLELKEKELKEIAKKIEQESQKKIDEINRQVEKQNEENTKLAQELKRAQESNNKTQVAKIATLLQEGLEKSTKLNNQKKDVLNKDDIMKLLTAHAKPWYQKINYKNPWLYGQIFFLILVTILVIWLIRKALSYFVRK